MSALAQLPASKRSQLVQACVGIQCQLLLGAGASMDSYGGDGKFLPGAATLAREIETQFGLAPSDRDLREIVGRVLRRKLDGDLYAYLHSRFSNTTPAPWYSRMTSLAWKRIWTLNVDDVITRAWSNNKWPHVQPIKAYSWDQPFEEDDRRLQVVHLHGHVHDPSPRHLIFALIEYVEATTAPHKTWHSVFGDLWLQSPFIVVGAGLRDEIDLARFLENRTRLHNQVALYVVPAIEDDWREDLELWGLSVVQATAEEFFAELNSDVRPRQEQRLGLKKVHGRAITSLVSFGQHFTLVNDLLQQPRPKHHDLLRGDYPAFYDVANGVDVQFQFSREVERTASERVDGGHSCMLLVMGEPFSGKTLAIMRAATNLAKAGRAIYWFRGEARPNARLVIEALGHLADSVVLVADDITPWSSSFADIIEQGRAKGYVIVVIAAARSKRLPFLVSSVSSSVWDANDIFYSAPLVRRDAEDFDHLMDRTGRLNHLQREPKPRRLKFLLDVMKERSVASA